MAISRETTLSSSVWKSSAPPCTGRAQTSSTMKSGAISRIRQGRDLCAAFGSLMRTSIRPASCKCSGWPRGSRGMAPSRRGPRSRRTQPGHRRRSSRPSRPRPRRHRFVHLPSPSPGAPFPPRRMLAAVESTRLPRRRSTQAKCDTVRAPITTLSVFAIGSAELTR